MPVVGRTLMVEITTFAHGAHEHRDPEVEQFSQHEIVFTLEDRWGIRSGRGDVVAHPGVVVLGNRHELYQSRHFEAIPRDRNFCVAFPGLPGRPGDPLADWVEQQDKPLFGALSLPLLPDLRWYLQALMRETRERVPGYRLKLDTLCSALLVDVVRMLGQDLARSGTGSTSRRQTAEALESTRALMDQRFAEDLDLATLAGAAGLSPYHFSRLFREFTGLSPHQYLIRKRLEWAEVLLRETDLRVTDVALSVGFEDATHFSRAFRRHSGKSPGQFRGRRQQD